MDDAVTAHTAAVKASADAVTAHGKAVTKETELKAWVAFVKPYMTNTWSNDDSQPQFKTWMENSFTMADLKSDAGKIQDGLKADLATATTAWDAAKKDVTSTEAKVTSTAATEKTDAATLKTTTAAHTKKADADTEKAMAAAVTAHTAAVKASADAVTAHGKAVTKETDAKDKHDELTAWVAWGKATLKNNWDNTTQPW